MPNSTTFAIASTAKKPGSPKIGQAGENLATDFLKKIGYQILARNFKVVGGEVDIIALDDNQVVLVEVKTRTNTIFGRPEEAISQKKLDRISRTGQIWLAGHQQFSQNLRIDLVAILGKEISHYQNIGNF